MSNVIRLATEHDSEDLYQLGMKTPVPGYPVLTYEQGPDYFAAEKVKGEKCRTVVGIDSKGNYVGTGSLATNHYCLSGEKVKLGYLGGLRIRPEWRNCHWLARGYHYFRQLHESNPVPGYLTTIISKNDAAKRILTAGRIGLPNYHPVGRYRTRALLIKRPSRLSPVSESTSIKIDPYTGNTNDLINVLHKQTDNRPFFQVYQPSDFEEGGRFGLTTRNFFQISLNGEPIGVFALWDQSHFKRHRVTSWGIGRYILPITNSWRYIRGYAPLPATNQCPKEIYLSFLTLESTDTNLFNSVMKSILQLKHLQNHDILLIGSDIESSLHQSLSHFPQYVYDSDIYFVSWEQKRPLSSLVNELSTVPLNLELGCL